MEGCWWEWSPVPTHGHPAVMGLGQSRPPLPGPLENHGKKKIIKNQINKSKAKQSLSLGRPGRAGPALGQAACRQGQAGTPPDPPCRTRQSTLLPASPDALITFSIQICCYLILRGWRRGGIFLAVLKAAGAAKGDRAGCCGRAELDGIPPPLLFFFFLLLLAHLRAAAGLAPPSRRSPLFSPCRSPEQPGGAGGGRGRAGLGWVGLGWADRPFSSLRRSPRSWCGSPGRHFLPRTRG